MTEGGSLTMISLQFATLGFFTIVTNYEFDIVIGRRANISEISIETWTLIKKIYIYCP